MLSLTTAGDWTESDIVQCTQSIFCAHLDGVLLVGEDFRRLLMRDAGALITRQDLLAELDRSSRGQLRPGMLPLLEPINHRLCEYHTLALLLRHTSAQKPNVGLFSLLTMELDKQLYPRKSLVFQHWDAHNQQHADAAGAYANRLLREMYLIDKPDLCVRAEVQFVPRCEQANAQWCSGRLCAYWVARLMRHGPYPSSPAMLTHAPSRCWAGPVVHCRDREQLLARLVRGTEFLMLHEYGAVLWYYRADCHTMHLYYGSELMPNDVESMRKQCAQERIALLLVPLHVGSQHLYMLADYYAVGHQRVPWLDQDQVHQLLLEAYSTHLPRTTTVMLPSTEPPPADTQYESRFRGVTELLWRFHSTARPCAFITCFSLDIKEFMRFWDDHKREITQRWPTLHVPFLHCGRQYVAPPRLVDDTVLVLDVLVHPHCITYCVERGEQIKHDQSYAVQEEEVVEESGSVPDMPKDAFLRSLQQQPPRIHADMMLATLGWLMDF